VAPPAVPSFTTAVAAAAASRAEGELPPFDTTDATRQLAQWQGSGGSDGSVDSGRHNKKKPPSTRMSQRSDQEEAARTNQTRRDCILQLAQRLFNEKELQEMHTEAARLEAMYEQKHLKRQQQALASTTSTSAEAAATTVAANDEGDSQESSKHKRKRRSSWVSYLNARYCRICSIYAVFI